MHIFKLGKGIGLDVYGRQSSCCTATLLFRTSGSRPPRGGALFWAVRPTPVPPLGGSAWYQRTAGFLWPLSPPPVCFLHNTQSDLLQRRGNRARPSVVPQLLGHSPASLRGLRVLPSLVLPSLVMYHAPGILHSNSHSQAPHTTFSPSATCA